MPTQFELEDRIYELQQALERVLEMFEDTLDGYTLDVGDSILELPAHLAKTLDSATEILYGGAASDEEV